MKKLIKQFLSTLPEFFNLKEDDVDNDLIADWEALLTEMNERKFLVKGMRKNDEAEDLKKGQNIKNIVSNMRSKQTSAFELEHQKNIIPNEVCTEREILDFELEKNSRKTRIMLFIQPR